MYRIYSDVSDGLSSHCNSLFKKSKYSYVIPIGLCNFILVNEEFFLETVVM